MKCRDKTCLHAKPDEEIQGIVLNSFKLKVLGILWCDGNADEKIKEFWDLIQGEQETIAACDRENLKAYKDIVHMSTQMVFKHL